MWGQPPRLSGRAKLAGFFVTLLARPANLASLAATET